MNAARITAACGGRVLRPRYVPVSRRHRRAHNASGPVVFTPEKISGVCGRGSPPSCKLPMFPGPDGGGVCFRRGEKISRGGWHPVCGRANPNFQALGVGFASLIRAGAPLRCARTHSRPSYRVRLHKAEPFFCVQVHRFRFTIDPFCCVFPAYLHYTPSKTACEVLLLFSTPYVEKLITTTKENEWPRGGVIDFMGGFSCCKPSLYSCMAAAAACPAASDRTDIPWSCRIFRYSLRR